MAPPAHDPRTLRSDRAEVITPCGQGDRVDLAPGVSFECLAGSAQHARDLTTGIAYFERSASLPYHTHPFGESVTLLEGIVEVLVEGRRYLLREYDNITLPRGLAHQVRNLSHEQSARLHVAMASHAPTRTMVEDSFFVQPMPDDCANDPGKERVTRLSSAKTYAAGPNTAFVDYFNRDLMPTIEMSGGYARFQPGGRLPAHYHDFDESICIVEGTASCLVEGQRYSMADCTTAMQPRGKVHYFINQTESPMAMIWVYAGPLPERIVVEDNLALTGLEAK